jgi:hypothetical protein
VEISSGLQGTQNWAGSLVGIALLYPWATIMAHHSPRLAFAYLVLVRGNPAQCSLLSVIAPQLSHGAAVTSVERVVQVTCLRNVSATFAFTSSMVVLNVASPKEHIGAINGAGQTLASFVGGAAAALGGGLWSASVSSGLPGSQFSVFCFISCVAVGGNMLYALLNQPV